MADLRALATRILERARELDALRFGDFTLTSGAKSNYYFDGRVLTLDPEGADLVSEAFLAMAIEAGATGVGGPTVAAVPIAGALALRSRQAGSPMDGFFVRDEAKAHGARKQVEGAVKPGTRVVVFDDGGRLRDVDERAAVRARHMRVRLEDQYLGDERGRRRVVDRDAQTHVAVLVHRRDCGDADIHRDELGEQARDLVEEVGREARAALGDSRAVGAAHEQRVPADDVLEVGVEHGRLGRGEGQQGAHGEVREAAAARPLGDGREHGRGLPGDQGLHDAGAVRNQRRRVIRGRHLASIFFLPAVVQD